MQATAPITPDFRSITQKFSQKYHDLSFKKKQTVLSVSLLNGRLRALSIVKDTIGTAWECPGRIHSPETIHQAIKAAIQHTEFPGNHIAFLADDSRFKSHTLQLPPMPSSDLLPLLQRTVQQEKTWEGTAAWRYRVGLEARGKRTIHLEIWPQDFVDHITRICEELGLYLRQLAPLSALSESQLSGLPVEPGEGSLLITQLEGRITFVAGKDDGSLLWTRHLYPSQDWVPLGERVATEANRTTMFLTQQTNLTFSTIWFLGDEGSLSIEEIQSHIPTPILPCPVFPDWKYWLWVGATLPTDHPSNFTPKAVLRAPWEHSMSKGTVVMIVMFLLLSVSTTGIIEGFLWKNKKVVKEVAAKNMELRLEEGRWGSQLVALREQQQWSASIVQPSRISVESAFLGYLGNVVPSEIILQKAGVTRTGNGWTLELTGMTANSLSRTLQQLDHLAQRLTQGPFHINLEKEWRDQLLTQPAKTQPEKAEEPIYRFTMKGTFS